MGNTNEKEICIDPCSQPLTDHNEEIVISGMAGRFPESNNMKELQDNLMNKVDMITDDDRRWKLNHPDIPQRTGKVNNIDKFDAQFFGVHSKQAHAMDPMCRMLMEHAYEAIVDAGVNPCTLRGSNIGVFIGSSFSESEKTWFYEKPEFNGLGITGCSRTMLSNRLSYWLGVTGPSYTIDTACSASLFAVEHGYRAILNGQCDAALVGGAHLCLHPYVSLGLARLGVLCPDGRCKSFDADANGYTRSEAISVAYLQKSKDAKRIYATIIHGKTNCDGFKEQGITFPSNLMQRTLLREFYEECQISPKSIAFVEAHGTGTKVGDPEEVNAIDSIFCSERIDPLIIGSVKSNLGHTEAASGMCSIAKVIIANESGKIPPNLHYKKPREDVQGLEEGRIRVITEPESWNGGYVGVSSFGFGGANAHILLKSNEKKKIDSGAPKDDLPRLVVASGRIQEATEYILTDIESRPVDVEYIRLLHDVHAHDIPGHLYRGYTIVGNKAAPEKYTREIERYSGAKRPIWFVFSGMGSQWPTMGSSLLRFPIFAEAIHRCDAVLKIKGIDIYDILTNPDESTFENIINSFVGIAAVQIGLVDLLKSLEIIPDNIIGHSAGELGCAYADGCFTAEQTILAAYSRGLAVTETETILGSMAAVGLPYSEVKDLCPPDIDVACHNSSTSSTISGPADSIKAFIDKLSAEKIFVKKVQSNNIAYHSRYIADAGPKLLRYLEEIIPTPTARSSKWLSTSVPQEEWSTVTAHQLSSAEYHTNNLLRPVLFEETCVLIPKDAVTIEIAPHGLLQAILRRSLDPNVANVSLAQRGHADNVEVFLQGIGKLYNAGCEPQIAMLYPEVTFPVSRGTPMISPLIKWEHSEDWYVASYKMQEKITSGGKTVVINVKDEDYAYISGYVMDKRNFFPVTGYLVLIWETLAMMGEMLHTDISVVFEDIQFLRATIIPKNGTIDVKITLQEGSGRFEVLNNGLVEVTGYVRQASNVSAERIGPLSTVVEDVEEISSRDVYKELRLRGYHYRDQFQAIKSATASGSRGLIAWANNWVTFMDSMLQMKILGMDSRALCIPTGIQKLVIDTKKHLKQIHPIPDRDDEDKVFQVIYDKALDRIVSGGIEIHGLKTNAISRKRNPQKPVIESYKFITNQDDEEISLREAVQMSIHLAFENHLPIKAKIFEFFETLDITTNENSISSMITDILNNTPLLQAEISIVFETRSSESISIPENIDIVHLQTLSSTENALLLYGKNLLSSKNSFLVIPRLLNALKEGGFILTIEENILESSQDFVSDNYLKIILRKAIKNGKYLLLLRKSEEFSHDIVTIAVNNENFSWLYDLKAALLARGDRESRLHSKIVLFAENNFKSGLLGLLNSLRKEPGGEMIRGFILQDPNAPVFDITNAFYKKQMELDLAINVLRPNPDGSKDLKSVWGTYRYIPLAAPKIKNTHHASVTQLIQEDLDSFRWVEGSIPERYSHADLIKVVYSSVNSEDVMIATGKLATNNRNRKQCVLGFEYSGVDESDERIMGLTPSETMTNLTIVDRQLSWTVPKNWSLEDAVTVPYAYTLSYWALFLAGNIKRGDKVLIHAGSSGIGQAAITLALSEECEVFTTVGTPDKRRFIKEKFPKIRDDHIGNSRDTSFEQMVLGLTNGEGVNFVLNLLAGDKMRASIRCLAKDGTFLEVKKFDAANSTTVEMPVLRKDMSFHKISWSSLFEEGVEKKLKLKKMLQNGLDNGIIKPLTRTVFTRDKVDAAFRYMAAGKHIGKVVIKLVNEMNLQDITIPAYPRYHCLPDRSYLIVGGLGGFGLELADWLVLRGAKNLVLTSRSGIKNGYQKMRIKLWESYGTRVKLITGKEAHNRQDCIDILTETTSLGPVDAIFNLAVSLKDSLWDNQTPETFEESFKGKAWSTQNFDELSRRICPLLRHFVVFSSVSCGRGHAGQINYGMSNSVMERICEERVSMGLPGLAIQWGCIGDVGLLVDAQKEIKDVVLNGTRQQDISSCLRELNNFLTQSEPIVLCILVAEKQDSKASLNVVETVLKIMGLKDLNTIIPQKSLSQMGMDSIMAVEIKNALEREFEVFLSLQDIRNLNFAKLIEMK